MKFLAKMKEKKCKENLVEFCAVYYAQAYW